MSTRRDLVVKRIAELVRAGATLTSYTCPACGTVLVRLKTGEYIAPTAKGPWSWLKSEEEAQKLSEVYSLREVRQTVFNKILTLGRQIGELDGEELYDRLRTLSILLDIYEKLSKMSGS
jgi:Uncharacterized Zn-finger containing protein